MSFYETIAQPLLAPSVTVNGSRFIAHVYPVSDAAQAGSCLRAVRTQFSDASHHCWAYRLNGDSQTRSSDDGEPRGSAGRPILAQIEGHNLFDVMVIITRYFGGTKLGVGGLVRAYGRTTAKALEAVVRQEVRATTPLVITFGYESSKAIDAVLRAHRIEPIHTEFNTQVCMRLDVPCEQLALIQTELVHRTAGQIKFSH
ncbi:MAG: YigZ family protein [Myxococcota bacterium]|nr:YigZ family protein [Myxococcota bacterium]